MTPDKALELVGRYARLTHAIKGCKARIGAELDKCQGWNGFRHETQHVDGFDGGPMVGWIDAYDEPTKRAQQDQETHLAVWYSGDIDDNGRRVYAPPDEDECAACYAAHLIVQERKALRRQLGAVKAAMTRGAK